MDTNVAVISNTINNLFLLFPCINFRINKSVNNPALVEGGNIIKLWAKPRYRSHMIAKEWREKKTA